MVFRLLDIVLINPWQRSLNFAIFNRPRKNDPRVTNNPETPTRFMNTIIHHIHLVSDATGETINHVARACLVQFDAAGVQQHVWNLVRSERQLDLVLQGIAQFKGLVLYTFVDLSLREKLETYCKTHGIRAVSVLDPVLKALRDHLGREELHRPGRQHRLDDDYFARIAAMDFAIAQDDGQGQQHLASADVLILGVSRTSKTPTCVYLANRGIKAANIPIVPGTALPDLSQLKETVLVVGLTKEADSLAEIRKSRLQWLNQEPGSDYADPEKVREEVQEARRLFARLDIPVLDVTRRSIEETAAEIMSMLSRWQERRQLSQTSGER